MNTKEKEKYIEEFDFPFCEEASKYEKIAKIGQGTFGQATNLFYKLIALSTRPRLVALVFYIGQWHILFNFIDRPQIVYARPKSESPNCGEFMQTYI